MNEKRSVAAQIASGYQRARKKEKGVILGQFIELTGYARCYAARLLRQHGKKIRVGKTKIIGDVTKKPDRKRQRIYDGEVIETLRKIWMIMDFICGKRLKAALADLIPVLKENMEIQVSPSTEEKLLRISASTIESFRVSPQLADSLIASLTIAVKRISGHKTLVMVERYSHEKGAHIQAAMDKLSDQYRNAG